MGRKVKSIMVKNPLVALHGSTEKCAEVVYVPEETPENRYQEPLRYVAIRIRKKQQGLFAAGSAVKHFSVLTITR